MPLFHVKLEGPDTDTIVRVPGKIEAQHLRLRNFTVECQQPQERPHDIVTKVTFANQYQRTGTGASGGTLEDATEFRVRNRSGSSSTLRITNSLGTENEDIAVANGDTKVLYKDPSDTVHIPASTATRADSAATFVDLNNSTSQPLDTTGATEVRLYNSGSSTGSNAEVLDENGTNHEFLQVPAGGYLTVTKNTAHTVIFTGSAGAGEIKIATWSQTVDYHAYGPLEVVQARPHAHSGYLVDLSNMFATTTKEIMSQSTEGAPVQGGNSREPHARLHIPINKTTYTSMSHHVNCGFDSHVLQGEWPIRVTKDLAYGQDNTVEWGTTDGKLTAINLYFEYETNDNQH